MKNADLKDVQKFLRKTAAGTEPRRATVFEAVTALLAEILALKKLRYTDKEICSLLAEKGIKLSLGTFRQYFRRARIAQRQPPKRRSEGISISAAEKACRLEGAHLTPGHKARGPGHRLDEDL